MQLRPAKSRKTWIQQIWDGRKSLFFWTLHIYFEKLTDVICAKEAWDYNPKLLFVFQSF